jgi:GTPase SAR1 family protein
MLQGLTNSSTEGDVETLVALPLLTDPSLLNIPKINVKSKTYLASQDIDKGAKRKSGYIPDYCVVLNSIPVAVIECKSPSGSVDEAYREGSLYCLEINKKYAAGLNPCKIVIATNGIDLKVGYWDSHTALNYMISDLTTASSKLEDLKEICSFLVLQGFANETRARLRIENFKRPFNQGEGIALIHSKIESNTFAADITPILRKYFASRSIADQKEIYEKAYISSNELSSHDRILESFLKDRIVRSKNSNRTEMQPTRKNEPTLARLLKSKSGAERQSGMLQLLTGGVGAGKSLFVRRYKEYLQPAEIKENTRWAFIDFNEAPANDGSLEEWLCDEFTKSILEEGASFDLTDGGDQLRLFAPKIKERQAFYDRISLAKNSVNEGEIEKARDIEAWRLDKKVLAECIARYIQGDRSEILVVVFDNVDQRESDVQLKYFQLAQRFISTTKCLLILQMRDVTFERFKNEPPLDAYRTGTIFHVSPPPFISVVRKRLEIVIEKISAEAPDTLSFTLPNGAKVNYSNGSAGGYLINLYNDIFQRPRSVSTIIEAIAGKDIRRSLDMFMSIITSGHMNEEIAARVARNNGNDQIPEFRILKVLMRGDYKFFSEASPFVTNIFGLDNSWERPNNFVNIEILFWLIKKRKLQGDNGQNGYFSIVKIINQMEKLGFETSDTFKACQYLLKRQLVEADTLSLVELSESDCVKATASGWAHMTIMCNRMEYLVSVLPTTPISAEPLRSLIFERMKQEASNQAINKFKRIELVEQFVAYLKKQHLSLSQHYLYGSEGQTGAEYVIEKIESALSYAREGKKKNDQLDMLNL